jgi:lysophospholipase L1-like esterase
MNQVGRFIAMTATIATVATAALGATIPIDPNPIAAVRLYSLGDSYTSGEGAKRYFPGTNQASSNECRRAPTAYPRVVAERKKLGLTFVACSGATTEDVLTRAQEPNSPADIFGSATQISALTGIKQSDIITIGIGGNDAGFGKVVQTCLSSDCSPNQKIWMDQMPTVQASLVKTFAKLREFGATVFALTYPNPLAEKDCIIGFNESEWRFLRDEYIPALNKSVRVAAFLAGVNVIDVETAFVGYRVCETSFASSALNVISISGIGGTFRPLKFLHNSFHPNRRGHALLSLAVQEAITRTTGNPQIPALPTALPAPAPPDPSLTPPVPDGSPSGGGGSAATLPPIPFPTQTGCEGAFLSYVLEDTATSGEYSLSDAQPDSPLCIQFSKANQPQPTDGWALVATDFYGNYVFPITKRQRAVVLYRDNTGAWNQLTVTR